MSSITIIVILILLVLALLTVSFTHNLVKDILELKKQPLEKKFEVIIQCVNEGLLDGGGQIVTFENDKRQVNLFNSQTPNKIIHFIYGTGNLSIIFKYKFFQVEMNCEELYKGVREISLMEQQNIADDFVQKALSDKLKHEKKVLQDHNGTPLPDSFTSVGDINPLQMTSETFDSFSHNQKIAVALMCYLIGESSHTTSEEVVESVTFQEILMILHLTWLGCNTFYVTHGESRIIDELSKDNIDKSIFKSMVLFWAVSMATNEDPNKMEAGLERLVSFYERLGISEDEVVDEIQKLKLMMSTFCHKIY